MAEVKRMKRALYDISTPEERADMSALELIDFNENYDKYEKNMSAIAGDIRRLEVAVANNSKPHHVSGVVAALSEKFDSIKQNIEDMKQGQMQSTEVMARAMAAVFHEMKDELVGSLGRLRGVVEEQNAGPLYKTMINAISGVEKAVVSKPVPTWHWPQYASVGVRNKSFTNINPATDGLGIGDFDYFALVQASTTDTYTFKAGGASGVTVATVVINYTDSSKGTISTVVKTPIVVPS